MTGDGPLWRGKDSGRSGRCRKKRLALLTQPQSRNYCKPTAPCSDSRLVVCHCASPLLTSHWATSLPHTPVTVIHSFKRGLESERRAVFWVLFTANHIAVPPLYLTYLWIQPGVVVGPAPAARYSASHLAGLGRKQKQDQEGLRLKAGLFKRNNLLASPHSCRENVSCSYY